MSDVTIRWHEGSRRPLRTSFELAEDSPGALAEYIDLGRVLVAFDGDAVAGHLQLLETVRIDEMEVKSLAVGASFRKRGVARALVERAVEHCRGQLARVLVVSTAAPDVGVLRFYQRVGFRMRSIERDAFTPETGYPPDLFFDGILLRDRVWLDLEL